MNKVEGKSPVLYSKLIYSEKHNKMITLFYTNKKKIINPLDYMNQCCYVKLVSTTESIFNGCFLVFFFFFGCCSWLYNRTDTSNLCPNWFLSKPIFCYTTTCTFSIKHISTIFSFVTTTRLNTISLFVFFFVDIVFILCLYNFLN